MVLDIEKEILNLVKNHKEQIKDMKNTENEVKFILNQVKITCYILAYMYNNLILILGKEKSEEAIKIANSVMQSDFGEHLTFFTSLLLLEGIPKDKIPDQLSKSYT